MRFRFTFVVWGDWHIDQFVKHGLPSLRAPGNLDAIDYHISATTRPSDLERVQATLDGLNAEVRASLPDDVKSDQGTANSKVHDCKIQDYAAAQCAGEAWALLAPDMVWGEGTLAHHRQAFEAGKTAIYRPLLRVDAEKVGTISDFSRRALAKVALEYEHSVAKMFYRADTPLFSSHSEMIIWNAPGGLLNKTITADIQTCMARQIPLVEFLAPDENKMLVVGDSDEAITLAMAPPNKDTTWLVGTEPLSIAIVRAFLKAYPSPASEKIARHSYRLHANDINPADWVDIEQHANKFIDEVFK